MCRFGRMPTAKILKDAGLTQKIHFALQIAFLAAPRRIVHYSQEIEHLVVCGSIFSRRGRQGVRWHVGGGSCGDALRASLRGVRKRGRRVGRPPRRRPPAGRPRVEQRPGGRRHCPGVHPEHPARAEPEPELVDELVREVSRAARGERHAAGRPSRPVRRHPERRQRGREQQRGGHGCVQRGRIPGRRRRRRRRREKHGNRRSGWRRGGCRALLPGCSHFLLFINGTRTPASTTAKNGAPLCIAPLHSTRVLTSTVVENLGQIFSDILILYEALGTKISHPAHPNRFDNFALAAHRLEYA